MPEIIPMYEVSTTDNDIRLILFMFDMTLAEKNLPKQIRIMLNDLKGRIISELPNDFVLSLKSN